jgi:glycosyltransferase involved in cell wall biosynthesis
MAYVMQNKLEFDVVHCHMMHYPVIVGIALRWMGKCKKLVVTCHGSDINVYGRIPHFQPVIIILAKSVDMIITVDARLELALERMGVSSEFIYSIPNGVSDSFFQIENASSIEFDVFFFGSIKWQKGLKYLIKAGQLLGTSGMSIRVGIAGDGPETGNLMNLASNSSAVTVEFLGLLGDSDLRYYLARSKLVVFPSLSEGFPCALLEAMAAGKPVIATEVGAFRLFNHRSEILLVPPKRIKPLARMIQQALENPEMTNQIAERGQALVRKNYRWECIVTALEEVYSLPRKESKSGYLH